MDLNDIKETMVSLVERLTHAVVERGEEVAPVAFVFKRDGSLDINGMLFTSREAKHKLMAEVASQTLQPEVEAVVMLLDCYMVEATSRGEVEVVMATGGVSQQPDRQEHILLMVIKDNQIVATGSQRYDRVLESTRIKWHPWIWRDATDGMTIERGF